MAQKQVLRSVKTDFDIRIKRFKGEKNLFSDWHNDFEVN